MTKRKKVQPEHQRFKKRSRAAKKGWRTRRKKIKERSEVERLVRENKELRDALEAQKDARQKKEKQDAIRKLILEELGKRGLDAMGMQELIAMALEEGIMRPEEIKGLTIRERLLSATDEERKEIIREMVQRRMDRARRVFGDTVLEAYLLVDEFEEFGFEEISSIYDLWDSDPGMAA